MALTTHHHPAPRSKKEWSYTSSPLMGLRVLFYGELSGFGGLVVSMLVSGTQDRGFTPSQSCRIFWAKKSSACLPSEGK
jgi:hypothetical protein